LISQRAACRFSSNYLELAAPPPSGLCYGTESDRRGSGVGLPAVAGVEATSGTDADERGPINARAIPRREYIKDVL